jgi:hypothetical protein
MAKSIYVRKKEILMETLEMMNQCYYLVIPEKKGMANLVVEEKFFLFLLYFSPFSIGRSVFLYVGA